MIRDIFANKSVKDIAFTSRISQVRTKSYRSPRLDTSTLHHGGPESIVEAKTLCLTCGTNCGGLSQI